MPDQQDLDEQFDQIHRKLSEVDSELQNVTKDIEELFQNEIDRTEVEVDYSVRTGTVEARLPLDQIASEISKELPAPIWIHVDGDTLVINDLRRKYSLDILDLEGSQRDRIKSVLQVIESLEQQFDEGAPEDAVIAVFEQAEVDTSMVKHEIDKLKQKGEVYEPRTDHLRTT